MRASHLLAGGRLFLKFLCWSIVAAFILFVSGCFLSFNPGLRYALFGGDHSASANLGDTGLVLTVELTGISHLAEYERHLMVRGNWKKVSQTMWLDHGGFPRANLYRRPDGNYVLAGSLDTWLISTSPLKVEEYSESYLSNRDKGLYSNELGHSTNPPMTEHLPSAGTTPPSRYFKGLSYIGTFDFADEDGAPVRSVRYGKFRFVEPHLQPEYLRDPGG
jgi:hypothetical protein